MSLGEGQSVLQTVQEESAVGQVREPVVKRIVRKQFLSSLSLGDVTVHDYQFVSLSFCVADGAGGRFQSAPGTVFMAYTVLHRLSVAGESGLFRGFQYSRAIVGMNLVERRSG